MQIPPIMKNLLSLLLTFVLSQSLFAQDEQYNFQLSNTGSNMIVAVLTPASAVLAEEVGVGGLLGAFIDVNGEPFCVGYSEILDGFFTVGLWGDDSNSAEVDGLSPGQHPYWVAQNAQGESSRIGVVEYSTPFNGWALNGIIQVDNFVFVVLGCTDSAYLEYWNYDAESMMISAMEYPAEIDDGSCATLVVEGCVDDYYLEYHQQDFSANVDDGSCATTLVEAYVAMEEYLIQTIATSIATIDSLELTNALQAELLIAQYENQLAQLIESSNTTIDSLELANAQQISSLTDVYEAEVSQTQEYAYAEDPILIDLAEGWNMIGYYLRYPTDAAIEFQDIADIMHLVKDNNANVYWPEFYFNGIGNLTPGQGYQLRMMEEVEDFYFVYTDQRLELSPSVPQWAIDMEIPTHPNDVRSLVRIVNMLGQEVNVETCTKGEVLLYLYNDATVEKKRLE